MSTRPRTVRVSTDLPVPAAEACRLAQRPAVFRHVVWPVFGIGRVPDELPVGGELSTRLFWLLVIPAWTHTLRLESATETEIRTHEHGGMVRRWDHHLSFEPTSATSCRYTDEVRIEAGASTPLVVLFAQGIYRWRQRRWRRLCALIAPVAD